MTIIMTTVIIILKQCWRCNIWDFDQSSAHHHGSLGEDVHNWIDIGRAIQKCKDECPRVVRVVGSNHLEQHGCVGLERGFIDIRNFTAIKRL